MPDVEAKLNITAEYKQALAAIAMLGKALDAVQQRAKLALTVAGGGQNGENGAGKAEAEQRAAVEALSAAMKDAAAAAAMLTESVGKLTPALEAMGPQAEQVQQVLTLAEHYKQLAAAMGIAADAAAKYNASGAQQGEIDARIQKLMEENQRLMDMIASIREEYAAVVRRNAELNRANKERKESTKTVKEELEVTQDLSYQMQLAAMTKRELVAEIERLTRARKEAAKAGDEARYKELTEELKLARQAMTKLRQEQQIARIAWMQQAQTAQQLGANIRTVTEGMMNFGEAVENGTVNLTGMVSAVMSMSMAIKAGLGPLGWALLAVEALTLAWNSYAKSQKEAEEDEKKKQERIVNLTTAYHEAAAEVEKFKNAEARQAELNDLLSIYDDINARFRERNDLQEKSLRMIQAELAMQAKEEEQASVLARNDIMRAYWRGEIDEEERDSRLDRLKITQARNKQRQTAQLGQAKVSSAKNKVSAAYSARDAAGIELGAILGDGQIYNLSPEEMAKRAAAYNLSLQFVQGEEAVFNDRMTDMREEYEKIVRATGPENISAIELDKQMQKYAREFASRLAGLKANARNKKNALGGWSVEQIESGEYQERYAAYQTKRKKAQERVQKAEEDIAAAEEKLADAEEQLAIDLRQAEQGVKFAIRNAGQNVLYRQDKKAYEERKAAERAKKQAEEAARRELERRQKMQAAAMQEGEYEGMSKQARRLASGGAWGMLSDKKLTQAELRTLIATMMDEANAENEALRTLFREVIQFALANKQITANELKKQSKALEATKLNVIQ